MAKRTELLQIRLSPLELQLIRQFSERDDMSMSAFLRRHAIDYILKEAKKK